MPMEDYDEIEYGDVVFRLLDTRHTTLEQVRAMDSFTLERVFVFVMSLYGVEFDFENVSDDDMRRVVCGELQLDYDEMLYGKGAEIMAKSTENQARRVKAVADGSTGPSETKEKTSRKPADSKQEPKKAGKEPAKKGATETIVVENSRGKKQQITVAVPKNPGPHPTSKAGKAAKAKEAESESKPKLRSKKPTVVPPSEEPPRPKAPISTTARPNPSKHVETKSGKTASGAGTGAAKSSRRVGSNAKTAESSKPASKQGSSKPSKNSSRVSPGAALQRPAKGTTAPKKGTQPDKARQVPADPGTPTKRKFGERISKSRIDINRPPGRVKMANLRERNGAGPRFRNTSLGREPVGEYISKFLIKHKGKRIEELAELLRKEYKGTQAAEKPRKHILDYRSRLYRAGKLQKPKGSTVGRPVTVQR